MMIARVTVQEGEQYASGHLVDDLIDAREPKGILRAMLVEVCVVDGHPPLVVLFENEYWIRQPFGVVNFFDASGHEQLGEFFLDAFSFLY